MIARDIIKFDTKIEGKYPVNVWKISGVKIWPLIRIDLNFQLQKTEYNKIDKENSKGKIDKLLSGVTGIILNGTRSIRSSILDLSHRDSIHRSDIFFMTDNMDRVFPMLNGTLFDRVLDPLKDCFIEQGYSIFSMEEINGENKPKLPRYSNSMFYQIRDDIIRVESFASGGVKSLGSDVYLPGFEKFIDECSCYGVSIHLSKLIRQVQYIKKTKRYFQNIFERCGTKIVITRCWYSLRKMALCVAAKEMKIPIVDVQHGVAGGGEHHLYCQWTKIPEDGYELMPNVFWCNTAADAEAIRKWNYADIHTKVIVGGRSLQLFWQSDKGRELEVYYRNKFKEKIMIPDKSKVVLLSLQSLYKNTERYPEWLPQFIANHKDFFWLVRRHPMMDKTQKDFLQKISRCSNVNVEEASSYPLDVLLEFSDVHVTMFSTVAMEAADHGVATVFLSDSRDYSAVVSPEYILYGMSYEKMRACLNDGASRKSESVEEKKGWAAIHELGMLMG